MVKLAAHLCSVLAVCCLSTAAVADGAPQSPTIPSSAPHNWSGLYVGPQVGYGWADTGWIFPVDSYFTLPDGLRYFDADARGSFAGGHITWNRQIGPYVVGAGLAINGAALREARLGPFTALFPDDRYVTSLEAFGTLTGRLGYAHKDFLLYTSGGFARGHANFKAVSGPPGGGVVGLVKQHLNGWTLGGGLEYMLAPDIVVGIQYDYIRLYGEVSQIATTGTPSTDPFVLNTDDVSMHAVSVRLSLKLDPAATLRP